MKNLYLLFGFALMGVLFFACENERPIVEEIAVDSNEMLSVERTVISYAECIDSCLIKYQMCCCTIEWLYYDRINEEYFSHPGYYQFWETPEFCVAQDICETMADCFITHTVYDDSLMQCTTFTIWSSTVDSFNPPFWNFTASGTPRPTHTCVPPNTAMSITNDFWAPSSFIELHVSLTCVGADGIPRHGDYEILAGETVVIEFSGCRHRLDCLSGL